MTCVHFATILLLALPAQIANACAYNVRDVGFVTLDTATYTLGISLPTDTPKEQRASIEDNLFYHLMDANILGEVTHQETGAPSAILAYPGRDPLPLEVPANLTDTTLLDTFLAGIVTSTFREKIQHATADNYAVIFLVEGSDPEEYDLARQAANAAVNKISTRMNMLPKAIAQPPVVLALPQAQRTSEKILLWSLGINADDPQSHAAVLYGRARLMGKVLHGDGIEEKPLLEYMGIIGSDCECGLDRHWMQGDMLPARWDTALLEKISTTAGFDPENPRTKMEISMTLSKSQTAPKEGSASGKSPEDVLKSLYAYSEAPVSFEEEPGSPENDALLHESPEKKGESENLSKSSGIKTDLIIGLGIAAGILVLSAFLVLRGRQP